MDDILNAVDSAQEEVKVSEVKNTKAYPNKAKLREEEDVPPPPQKKAGRPPTGVKRAVFSTSLNKEMINLIDEVAKKTKLSKSVITEEAFELYMKEKGYAQLADNE